MEITIGPYILNQRTEYSKIQIFDNKKNNITNSPDKKEIVNKIMNDYNAQTQDKDSYFDIYENKLLRFHGKSEIEYLFIPDGIECIKESVFSFSKIKYVYIPDSVLEIDENAFTCCHKLEEIVLPNSLKDLDSAAFEECTSLKKAALSENMQELGLYEFGGCKNLEKITLPNSIKVINNGAFVECNKLDKINIPKNFEYFTGRPFAKSQINTLIFNYNKEDSKDPISTYGGFLVDSQIYKIEISKDVTHIDPNFFKYSRGDIKEIEYKGTKSEFLEFKKNNQAFLDSFKTININILEDLDSLVRTDTKSRSINKLLKFER